MSDISPIHSYMTDTPESWPYMGRCNGTYSCYCRQCTTTRYIYGSRRLPSTELSSASIDSDVSYELGLLVEECGVYMNNHYPYGSGITFTSGGTYWELVSHGGSCEMTLSSDMLPGTFCMYHRCNCPHRVTDVCIYQDLIDGLDDICFDTLMCLTDEQETRFVELLRTLFHTD